jgi:exosortase
MNFMTGAPLSAPSPPAQPPAAAPRWTVTRHAWTTIGVLGLALVWSYWTTLQAMAERWSTNPQYSHGFLVPLFAGAVLWFRRQQLGDVAWQPTPWGLPLLALGLGLRLVAVRMDVESIDAFSLLPALAGTVLFVGGWRLLAWCWPALAFLGFMLPLPFVVETALAHPLRRLATIVSTYLLQTLGYPALNEGNIIVIDQVRMGVVEACSGLGMLMTFFALATALVFVIQAPRADRIVLLASAAPIAVVANVLRITITGMVYYGTGDDAVQSTMHVVLGYLMMPLALGLFAAELWFLARLLPPAANVEPKPLPLWGLPPTVPVGTQEQLPSKPSQ